MAEIFVHKDPITQVNINATVVSVPPELGVTLSEAQAARDESALAVVDSQAAQAAAEAASTLTVTYRDEALIFRNEAEVFRNEAQAVASGDYVTNTSLQAKLDAEYYTQAQVANELTSYTTDVELAAALTGYYTTTEVDAALTGYSTDAETSTAISTALTDYYTAAEVDTLVGGIDTSTYVTNTNLSATLASYDLSTVVDNKIATAVSAVDLTGYYTSVETDTEISNAIAAIPPTDLSPYYTSVQTDSAISTAIAGIPATDLSAYYTAIQTNNAISTALTSYDTSAQVDAKVAGATMAASDILDALKTVDGDGSGLDADTLDGLNSTSLVAIGGEQLIIAKHRQRHGTFGDISAANEGQNIFSPSPTGSSNGGSSFSLTASGLPNIAYLGASHSQAATHGSGFYFSEATNYAVMTASKLHHNVKVSSAFGDFTNLTADGVVTLAGADVQIGTAAFTGDFDLTGNIVASGDITAFSDRRLKSDFIPISHAVYKVNTLNGYNYHRDDLDHRQDGLIADEVEAILPDSVKQGERYLGVNYNGVVALLVEAVKELSSRVEYLEAKL